MLPFRVTVILIAKVAILIAKSAIRQASLGILRKARRIFARPALKILCLLRAVWSFAAAKLSFAPTKPLFAPTKPLFARGILSFGWSKRSARRLLVFTILPEILAFSADQKPRPRAADVLQLRPFPFQRLSVVKCKESR